MTAIEVFELQDWTSTVSQICVWFSTCSLNAIFLKHFRINQSKPVTPRRRWGTQKMPPLWWPPIDACLLQCRAMMTFPYGPTFLAKRRIAFLQMWWPLSASIVIVIHHKVSNLYISRMIWPRVTKYDMDIHTDQLYSQTGCDIIGYFLSEVIGKRLSKMSPSMALLDFCHQRLPPHQNLAITTEFFHVQNLGQYLTLNLAQMSWKLTIHANFLISAFF